jgi:hypothetical protein
MNLVVSGYFRSRSTSRSLKSEIEMRSRPARDPAAALIAISHATLMLRKQLEDRLAAAG